MPISSKISVKRWLQASWDLLLPRWCAGCEQLLHQQEKEICLHCWASLPLVEDARVNPATLPALQAAELPAGCAAAFYFEQGARLQQLLHALKYKQRPRVGWELGRALGHSLAGRPYPEPMVVAPIPLHRRKQQARGYNQAERIAAGLAAVLNRPMAPNLLVRTRFTESQTGKNKEARQENVSGIFKLQGAPPPSVLLVDDVLTTGATLASAAAALRQAGVQQVYLAAVAVVRPGS